MARKTLGFVPLIWVCPYCETQNPGPIKTCTSCGAPQPDNVEFLQVDEEKFNFIKDEALIRMAKAGPDIHCPYCGTRNPAGAELCSNCGGEINIPGKVVRETGKEVQTITEAEQAPPSKPTATVEQQPKKKPSRMATIIIALVGLGLIAGCLMLLMMLLNTDTIEATVTSGGWERSVAVESFTTVTRSDWWDEIPEIAEIQSCTQRYRYTSDTFEPNATEVCSEPVVEDTGTGVGEVVQECVYEVYDDYCEYTVMDWVLLTTVVESGSNWDPYWPEPDISTDQRLGTTTEEYTIVFSGDGERYTYTTRDVDTFLRAQPGSRWALEVNQLGAITSIKPAN